jgi:putative hydrolase of the HAD superfamily
MSGSTQPIKAVFFDLGFTLLYFAGDFYKVVLDSYLVLADVLIANGCTIDRYDFAREFDYKMQNYYRQREQDFLERPVDSIVKMIMDENHQPALPENAYQQALQAMYLTTESDWLLEEDTHEVLQWLLDHQYRLSLISNASSTWDVNNLIDNHHLRPYFSAILISGDEGIRKPNPLIFEIAAKRLQIEPSQAIMVGDTLDADILGAHRSGMRAVWISRRKGKPTDTEIANPEMHPDAEIHTLKELPELLTAWNSL